MSKLVASTEFQTRAGQYIDEAAKEPVFITKHSRPVRVLMDIDEYERLKRIEEDVTEEQKKLVRERLELHRHTIEKLAR